MSAATDRAVLRAEALDRLAAMLADDPDVRLKVLSHRLGRPIGWCSREARRLGYRRHLSHASHAPSPEMRARLAQFRRWRGDRWTMEAIGKMWGVSRQAVHVFGRRHAPDLLGRLA